MQHPTTADHDAATSGAPRQPETEGDTWQAGAEAQANSEAFLRLVAHDLKSPLTNILGYAQLGQRLGRRLDGDGDTTERLQTSLTRIVENCRRLQRLVDNLQEAFRLGSGRFEPNRTDVDLVALAGQVVAEQQALTSEHTLAFESVDAVVGRWDDARLRQLLTNVLSNAVTYSPSGGNVRVAIGRDGGTAILRVSDEGIGIPPEDLPALFQPYSRLHRSRANKGAGLGLFIVKGIAEAHGGRVGAESAGEGCGCTISVTLPLA